MPKYRCYCLSQIFTNVFITDRNSRAFSSPSWAKSFQRTCPSIRPYTVRMPPPCDSFTKPTWLLKWKPEWNFTKLACCYSSLVVWWRVLRRGMLFFFYLVPWFHQLNPPSLFKLYLKWQTCSRREKTVFVIKVTHGQAPPQSFIKEPSLLYSTLILLECKQFSPDSGFCHPYSLNTNANWQQFCAFLLLKFLVLIPAFCNIL